MPTHLSDSLIFRPESDLIGAGFDGLPLHVMAEFGRNGNSGLYLYKNHFAHWEGPVAEGFLGGWTLSGTTGAATITQPNDRKGAIVLTADVTGSCNPTLALGSATAPAPIIYSVGKRLWLGARLKLVTVATTELFFGFGTPDTSPCVTGTFPSDGIFWHKASTDTKLSFQARQNGTGTDRALIGNTLLDDDYIFIQALVDEQGNIRIFQAGSELAASMIPASNGNIPDSSADVMQFMWGILGASMTSTLDWLVIAQEL